MSDSKPGGDERILAILAHLSPLIASIVSAGWLSIVGPLIVWLVWKNHSKLVRNASATSFNFNVTIWVAFVLGWILIITVVLWPIGLALLVIPGILQIIFSVWGALKASAGQVFKYPLQVPILH